VLFGYFSLYFSDLKHKEHPSQPPGCAPRFKGEEQQARCASLFLLWAKRR
jgi:uncharacterized short protein YbdD (DUF466 family)